MGVRKYDRFDATTPLSGQGPSVSGPGAYSYSYGGPATAVPACVQDCSPDMCLAPGSDTCLDDCSSPDMQALCSPQSMPMMPMMPMMPFISMMCQMNGYDLAPITQMCSAILSSAFSTSQRPTYSTHKSKNFELHILTRKTQFWGAISSFANTWILFTESWFPWR